jgi:hypothetical protein
MADADERHRLYTGINYEMEKANSFTIAVGGR